MDRGLFIAKLSLNMPLTEHHFLTGDGELRVKCRATLEAPIWQEHREARYKEIEVQESRWPCKRNTFDYSIDLK